MRFIGVATKTMRRRPRGSSTANHGGGDSPKRASALPKNLVPLPYSRVAVQRADFPLDDLRIRSFFDGTEIWFETDYVVFRSGTECAVARIEKTAPKRMFCRVRDVEVISTPDVTRWVEDRSIDTGNPSALADKARAVGIRSSETLIVDGLYEHVCFIHRPDPVVIDVFDLSPPDPPRLLDMTRRVVA
jgi:hypothetical protein